MSVHWNWALDGQSQFQRTSWDEQLEWTPNFPSASQRMLSCANKHSQHVMNFSSGSQRTTSMNSADPESMFSKKIMAGFPVNQLMISLNNLSQYSRNYPSCSQDAVLANVMDVQHRNSTCGFQNTVSAQYQYSKNFSPSSQIYDHTMNAHSRHSANISSGSQNMLNSRHIHSATNIPSGFQRDTLSNAWNTQSQYLTHFPSTPHIMLNSVHTESQHVLSLPSSNSQRNDCNSSMNLPLLGYRQTPRLIQTDDQTPQSHQSPYIFQKNCDLIYKEPQRLANVIPFFLRETSSANSMDSQVQHSQNFPSDSQHSLDTKQQRPSVSVERRRCVECGTAETTMWRLNTDKQTVCNACKLYFRLHKVKRPLHLRNNTIRRRNRKSKGTKKAPDSAT